MRQQIVAAAVAALGGLSTTGSNVFQDRDTDEAPLQSGELPGLVVSDLGDPAEIVSLGVGRILQRTMRLNVDAHVKSATSPGATVNQILLEVEVAIAAANLAGAKYAHLAEVGAREQSEAGDVKIVRQTFGFDIVYYTAHDAPDVAI